MTELEERIQKLELHPGDIVLVKGNAGNLIDQLSRAQPEGLNFKVPIVFIPDDASLSSWRLDEVMAKFWSFWTNGAPLDGVQDHLKAAFLHAFGCDEPT